jgi:hypothetical protein
LPAPYLTEDKNHMALTAAAASPLSAETNIAAMQHAIDTATRHESPYTHWFLEDCLSPASFQAALGLPFPAPELGGVSGKRELHNATRTYFDLANRATFPVCEAVAQAFQAAEMTRAIETAFGTKLKGSYLRIEYAQDVDGFWLEPHTDLGVKVFTMLAYLSTDPSHADLGTDIYGGDKTHVGRSPFIPNGALIFVPGTNTYHGFEPRKIQGVRKSIIINYVTEEWRAREQLAFPETPIAV